MLLVVVFAVEYLATLPAVEDPCPALQVQLAEVRLVGGLALQHHVAQLAVVRVVHLVSDMLAIFDFADNDPNYNYTETTSLNMWL